MKYDLIKTGSKGNAVVLNDSILVDIGVPFKALLGHYKKLSIALLTHEHQDHFNRATIKKLAFERPALRYGCPLWLVPDLVAWGVEKRNIDVCDMDKLYDYGSFKISPFRLQHNVMNCGWKIHFADGKKALYATDTNSMTGIEAKGYDLYLIEANYSEDEIIERIRDKQNRGEFCHEWAVLQNHLSREKAEDFIYQNAGQNSEYIFLHQHGENI